MKKPQKKRKINAVEYDGVTARLCLRFLGSLDVTLDGVPVTGFATDKVRALLAYLVVEADRPLRRELLAGLQVTPGVKRVPVDDVGDRHLEFSGNAEQGIAAAYTVIPGPGFAAGCHRKTGGPVLAPGNQHGMTRTNPAPADAIDLA